MHDRDRFDKFTERARRVLRNAQEEAQRFQHNYIGTEHLLLGLVSEGDGVGAKVLANLGISLDKVRGSIEFIIGRGDRIVLGEIGLTPRAKKVIELAVDEARRLNHHYIGTEHILLGLVREGEGIGAGVLESLGAGIENVRTETTRVLGGIPQEVEASSRQNFRASPSLFYRSNLSPSSLRVLTFAQGEALLLLHDHIGSEHLLLALMREPGLASDTLSNAGLTFDRVHSEIAQASGQGNPTFPNLIGINGDMAILLTAASEHASDLQHAKIEPYHLLLALLDEKPETIEKPYAAQTILIKLGIDIAILRTTLLQSIQEQS